MSSRVISSVASLLRSELQGPLTEFLQELFSSLSPNAASQIFSGIYGGLSAAVLPIVGKIIWGLIMKAKHMWDGNDVISVWDIIKKVTSSNRPGLDSFCQWCGCIFSYQHICYR